MIKAPKFWYEKKYSFISILLLPLNIAWITGGLIKKTLSNKNKINIPVVSVGSAIIGGSGKTPTVLFICKLLSKMGYKPHIVSRGYGGNYLNVTKVDGDLTYYNVGDEALMMSDYFPTWVARNRYLGCEKAHKNGADIVVLDDGLQTLNVIKDLSIYVFDGIQKFGNRMIVPAGPLRENIDKAISKCSVVFQINEEEKQIEFKNKFVAFAKYELEINHPLLEKKVIAFAGLGFNRKFFDQLDKYGFQVMKRIDFPDHHKYSIEDLYSLLDQANSLDAHLITTEKDYVRIPKDFKKSINFIKGQIKIDNEQDLILELKKKIV